MWFTSRSHNRQSAIFGSADARTASVGTGSPSTRGRSSSRLRRLLSTLTVTNTLDQRQPRLTAPCAARSPRPRTATRSSSPPASTARPSRSTSGELEINTGLTIQGPGAGLLTISGGKNSRVFQVNAGAERPSAA